jgi:hypothetical protein
MAIIRAGREAAVRSLIRSSALALCGAIALGSAALAQDGIADCAQVQARLQGWAKAHDHARLITYGQSAGERPLLALEVTAPGPLEPGSRPAVFVGANMAGPHAVGTQAALHLLETLLDGKNPRARALLAQVTFYVVPVLNPDAHEALFASVRWRRHGNGLALDRDRDGQAGEDGPDDLDGDGRITRMRIPDPRGPYVADRKDPRLMVLANPMLGQRGTHRVVLEGADDDGDGVFNEDGDQGIFPDRNFAHAFPYPAPEAGPWASAAPESRAIMDFLLARRNVALAIVYGPANLLLELPKGFEGQAPWGDDQPLEVPGWLAPRLGLPPGKRYTLDQLWAAAKATSPASADVDLLKELASRYAERLEAAGQEPKRAGRTTRPGGFAPWLYYHYGAFTLELDVWGVPKLDAAPPEGALTLGKLEAMSAEEFLALPEQKLADMLQRLGAPKRVSAASVRERVEGGLPVKKAIAMLKRFADAQTGGKDADAQRGRDLLAYLSAKAPERIAPWTAVTLPNGTAVEVGGVDPFADILPPEAELAPALNAHTETVLDVTERLARVALLELEATELGEGLWRLDVVAGNTGFLPTHTRMAVRARSHLPVRLELAPGEGVSLVSGQRWRSAERLEGSAGTLQATWLLRGARGARAEVTLTTQTAGRERRTLILGGAK